MDTASNESSSMFEFPSSWRGQWMLQRVWPWSPSLRISTVFTVAASPTWRSSPPTTPQCCASPPRGTALGALPSSCAPWKTVSTRAFKSLCLKFDLRFTVTLQSLLKWPCVRWRPQPVFHGCSFSLWQIFDFFFQYGLNLDDFFYIDD